jgi:predicted permease
MRDRWAELCRRLVPETLRECAFEPAAADLHQEWTSRRNARTFARLGHGLRLLVLALECRRLAVSARWSDPLPENRENRMSLWFRDLRHTIRQLKRQPMFAATAILTLALGTGANLTIFSFVNSFLLSPIQAASPDRLVRVYGVADRTDRDVVSFPDYVDARTAATGVDLAAHSVRSARVGAAESVEVRAIELVSGNYFRVMGVSPAAGRLIDQRDDAAEGSRAVVVLAHGFWRSRFAGSLAAIGEKLEISGVPFEIIGVAPPGYRGTFNAHAVDLWAPVTVHQAVRPTGLSMTRRGWGWLSMIGRLKPGVELSAVHHDLGLAAADIRQRFPDHAAQKFDFAITPASGVNESDREVMMAVLGTAFGFTVLLMVVTCANLAGVMQARLAARRREMAIRQSLGAGRGRLAAEWLTECLCLAAAGGLAGLGVARLVGEGLSRMPMPSQIFGDFSLETTLDWRLVTYGIAVFLISALIVGCAPAWRAGRLHVFPLLKDEGGTVTTGRRGTRLRRIAVFVQVTVSVVLLTAAGLLATGLTRQHGLTPGFRTDVLGLASFNLERESPDARRDLIERLIARVRSHPGVEAVDISTTIPLGLNRNRMGIAVPGYVSPEGKRISVIDFNTVGPDFFQALGIAFVAGQSWPARDVKPLVLVVNETFARRFWPNGNPVGQTVEVVGKGFVNVSGVVHDHAYYEIGEAPRPFIYVPAALEAPGSFGITVRTTRDPSTVMKELRSQIAAIDPRLAPYDVLTFEELRRVPLFPARIVMWTAVAFGAVALVLTGVGLYGVVSTSVAQRSREFGVRIALGARPSDLLRGVMREAGTLVAMGAVAGLVVSFFGARVLESTLTGAGTFTPMVTLPIAVALGALALAAAWSPARRAARVDPVVALKS